MSLLDEFRTTHPGAVVVRGSETYIERELVVEVIAEAERRGIRILGFEGFLIAEGGTYPLAQIADFSDVSDPSASAVAARPLVESKWIEPDHDESHPGASGRHMLCFVLDE